MHANQHQTSPQSCPEMAAQHHCQEFGFVPGALLHVVVPGMAWRPRRSAPVNTCMGIIILLQRRRQDSASTFTAWIHEVVFHFVS